MADNADFLNQLSKDQRAASQDAPVPVAEPEAPAAAKKTTAAKQETPAEK